MEQITLWEKKRDNNKREMVRAARNLFEKQGYHNTSVKALCDEVMISKTTFFNYFGSKDALIKIIFDSAFNDTRELIEEQFGEDGNPFEAIESILMCMVNDVVSYPEMSTTAYELMLRSDQLKSFKEGYENLLHKYVVKAKTQGMLRDGVPPIFATKLIMGSFYFMTFAEDTDDIKEQMMDNITAVLNLLR